MTIIKGKIQFEASLVSHQLSFTHLEASLIMFIVQEGNTKWGSIIVLLTSCLTGLESAV
jgi:hypothetical protein